MPSQNTGSLCSVFAVFMSIAALAATGCDGDEGTTVGPRGGIVTSDDGRVTLEIPAGALADDVEIAIVEATDLPDDAVGPAYAIEPFGLVFTRPAELVYDLGAGMDVDPSAVRLVVQRDQQWSALADRYVDMASPAVSASVLYSSTVGIVE